MHEIVKLYNNITKFNDSVKDEEALSFEVRTKQLSIVFWDLMGNEVKQCDTFKDANEWISRWSR